MLASKITRRALFRTRGQIRSYTNSVADIRRFGVIGAGQMGVGIALVAASKANLDVVLVDASQTQIDRGLKFIGVQLQKDVLKGKISEEESEDIRSRIKGHTTLASAVQDADFVVEAVTENPTLKRDLFKSLSTHCPPHTLLASNTSSISITKIAASTDRPDKVVGMHFMNPVPVMKLVELIPGLATSDVTLHVTTELARKMGKTTTVAKDMPGFVANRVLMPYINEAVFVLQEGTASLEDIDTTMKLGTNVPMGPLTLADFIGLDTCLSIMRVLHSQLGDDKYRPAPLLVKYVDAGWLGKKVGRGFYHYPKK